MNTDIRNNELTGTQRFILAIQTCQWWNAVFLQADRFFDVLEKDHGGTPWDPGEANSLFIAERMFLITAVFHAIEDLQKLDIELRRDGDTTFQPILEAIEKVSPIKDIIDLRNMNEHNLAYLMNMGHSQDRFRTTAELNGDKILTTAAWTVIHHDAKAILIGKVRIDKLLIAMKEQLPLVQEKTKAVFEKELIGN